MKTILVTDFRKNTASFINEIEHGETIVLIRRGKPVAEIIPFSDSEKLYQVCPSNDKSFFNFQEAGHNSPVWEKRIYSKIWKMISRGNLNQNDN